MKRTMLSLLILLTGNSLFAQSDSPTYLLTDNNQSDIYRNSLFLRPSSILLSIGSTGIGLDYHLGVSRNWELTVGGNWLPTLSSKKYYSDLEANADLRANFSNAHIMGGYHIFHASQREFLRSFQIKAGIGVFFAGNVKGSGTVDKTLHYGEIVIDKDRIGKMDGTVKWNPAAPYLGISLLPAIPLKGFGLSIDAGSYYIGKPHVKITGTGYLKNNQEFEDGLEKNLNGYRWFPVLQIGLTYRINSIKENKDRQK